MMNKNKFNIDIIFSIIFIPIFIYLFYVGYNRSIVANIKVQQEQQAEKVKNLQKTKNCLGDENCISKVRENFTNSGKQILSEQYLGDGMFGISFLDPTRGVSANAKVSTDCNCNVIDVRVSIMR